MFYIPSWNIYTMETLLTHCSAVFAGHNNLLLLFFFGGLTGSLTHCLVMCGPVVASHAACGGRCGKRMSTASQWQYHLGRMVTYGALGFFAALLSKQLVATAYWPVLSALLMVTASGLFLLSAFLPDKHILIAKKAPANNFLRGVLMSFMPCGLIYAALMMAATLANPLTGMVAMWMFVLGTLPALLLASGGAAMLAARWQKAMHGIGRFGMAFNGLTLLALAAKAVR